MGNIAIPCSRSRFTGTGPPLDALISVFPLASEFIIGYSNLFYKYDLYIIHTYFPSQEFITVSKWLISYSSMVKLGLGLSIVLGMLTPKHAFAQG